MLDFFNGSKKGGSGKTEANLQPPKNLPDLAKDMYEKDAISAVPSNTTQTPANAPVVPEPKKDFVPKLDMSAARQSLANSAQSLQSMQNNMQNTSQPVVQPVISQPTPATHYASAPQAALSYAAPVQMQQSMPQQMQQQPVSQPMQQMPQANISNAGMIVDSSLLEDGFFREFEDHIRNHGIGDGVVNDLISRNLLDNMVFYHTTRNDVPFYTNSAELNHAMKIKFEELSNLEKNWIANKQRLELLKKFNSNIEYDITLKSEELKKMLSESRKMGVGSGSINNNNSKPADFFSIVKPAAVPVQAAPISRPNAISVGMNYSQSPQPASISSANVSTPAAPVMPVMRFQLSKYYVMDQSQYFYAHNGMTFKSMADAINGLRMMDYGTFSYHINPARNDLSNWISGVFKDNILAGAIRGIYNRDALMNFFNQSFY